MSFYKKEDLYKLGLKDLGKNVFISKKCSIYTPENISIGDNVRIDDFCILSGHIRACDDLNDLMPMIFDFMKIEPKLSSNFIEARKQLFHNRDGNAAKRIADIMLKELN